MRYRVAIRTIKYDVFEVEANGQTDPVLRDISRIRANGEAVESYTTGEFIHTVTQAREANGGAPDD